jgi:hypothetical protein
MSRPLVDHWNVTWCSTTHGKRAHATALPDPCIALCGVYVGPFADPAQPGLPLCRACERRVKPMSRMEKEPRA